MEIVSFFNCEIGKVDEKHILSEIYICGVGKTIKIRI